MSRILVPLDKSTQLEAVLGKAIELFPDGEILALHVVQVTELPDDPTESATGLAESEAREVFEAAERIAGDHNRNIELDTTEGHAVEAIVSYAKQNNIDHIVMGSEDRSGVRRLLFGSVAESVKRDAPCAVTVAE